MSEKNECKPKTITIDDVEYVRKDSVERHEYSVSGCPYVIIRSYDAGVFAGFLKLQDDAVRKVILEECIRLWRWTGASLSQVARDGTASDDGNKFGVPTHNHEIFNVIEIIPATERARKAIQAVKSWEV